MIPENFIQEWRENARWQSLVQVEQDLIISRALVDLYNEPYVRESLAFRGGTALNKLFLKPPSRYSEDIDIVQKNARCFQSFPSVAGREVGADGGTRTPKPLGTGT